jgi:hypothetical protein
MEKKREENKNVYEKASRQKKGGKMKKKKTYNFFKKEVEKEIKGNNITFSAFF